MKHIRHSTIRRAAGGIVVLSAAVLLAACSSSGGAASATGTSGSSGAPAASDSTAAGVDSAARALLPDDIRSAGVVKIGLGSQFPPYSYHKQGSSDYSGYEPDLIKAILGKLGLTGEYSDVNSVGDAVPTIQSGRIQVAAMGITDNADREKVATFVDNLIGVDGAIVPKADDGKYKSFTDLCGLTVATVTGSVSVKIVDSENAECTKDGKAAMKQLQLPDNPSTLLAVQSGRAQAAMQTFPGASYQVAQNPTAFAALPINEGMNARFPNGIAVSNSEPGLAKAFQAALTDLVNDGTYATILKNNNVDPAINGITAVHLNWATNGFS